MEALVLDGKKYIKASKAAKDLGYTSDYVGQLCRAGKVSAHLIGRSWYVDQEELSTHRQEKKRMSRVKAREQAKKSIADHRAQTNKKEKNYRNITISYEEDPSELIPETRRLEVESKVSIKNKAKKTKEAPEKNIIENEGEKIIMSGDLKVVDVTDGAFDPHTTILEPTIIHEKPQKSIPKKKEPTKKETTRDTTGTQQPKSKGFVEKLFNLEVISSDEKVKDVADGYEAGVVAEDIIYDEPGYDTSVQKEIVVSQSIIKLPTFTFFILIAIVAALLPLSRVINYDTESVVLVTGDYRYSVSDTIALLKEKL